MKNRQAVILLIMQSLAVYAQAQPVLDIDLGGEPSPVVFADFNQDGIQDFAVIVVTSAESILFQIWRGLPNGKYEPVGAVPEFILANTTSGVLGLARDLSSNIVAVGDIDMDGDLDLASSHQILLNQDPKNFGFVSVPLPTFQGDELLFPTAILQTDSAVKKSYLFRGRSYGKVERCELLVDEDGQLQVECAYLQGGCALEERVSELVYGNFQNKNQIDIIAGCSRVEDNLAYLWSGGKLDKEPKVLENFPMVEAIVGDLNRDGLDDVMAQWPETVPDFPSVTLALISRGEGQFEEAQNFVNHDNHNDNAYLFDLNGDGWLDYLQIGVDKPFVGIRYYNQDQGKFLSPDPSHSVRVGWDQFPAKTGIGVQVIKSPKDKIRVMVRHSAIGPEGTATGGLSFYQYRD